MIKKNVFHVDLQSDANERVEKQSRVTVANTYHR